MQTNRHFVAQFHRIMVWVIRDLKGHLVPTPIPTPIYPPSSQCPLCEGTLCGLHGPLIWVSCRHLFSSQKMGTTNRESIRIVKALFLTPQFSTQLLSAAMSRAQALAVIYLLLFPARGSFRVVGCHLLLQGVTCSLLIPSQQAAPTDGQKFGVYSEHLRSENFFIHKKIHSQIIENGVKGLISQALQLWRKVCAMNKTS